MRKKLIALLAVVCVVCCAFWLAACDTDDNDIVEVQSITLDLNEMTMTEGEQFYLIATINPSYANDHETEWSSSNTGVATVDNGSVTAIAEGEATITVTTTNGKTASCVVTVLAKDPDPVTQYKVTFDANGGKFENNKTTYAVDVDEFSKIPDVTATRGDKYVFTGWYKNVYNTLYKWDTENDTVNDDITLYAGWKYLNSYQSVMDALVAKIQAEHDNEDEDVEILLIFTKDDYLCFVERDSEGVFSYKTDISGFETVAENAEIIAAIPTATITELNNYNDVYTSDNNAYIADCMAGKYTQAANLSDAIVYSCVSEWEEYSINSSGTGVNYGCYVKAIIADENGVVYDCSFTVVAGLDNFNAVIGGTALSTEVDMNKITLGDIANDFYAERVKELEA